MRTGVMEEWNSGTMGPVKKEFSPFSFLQYSNTPLFQHSNF
jgi:hypothetical protein